MSAQKRQRLDAELLRNRLKLRSLTSERTLAERHPEAKKFFEKVGLRPGQIRQHAARLLTSGALAGSLLLSAPTIPIQPVPLPSAKGSDISVNSPVFLQMRMVEGLKAFLPPVGQWQLTKEQEEKIHKLIRDTLGVDAEAELDGNRLNNSFGRMGAEQHLPRFPGDSAEQHGELVDKGITPGLGGWGYFAYSKDQLTPELEQTEKYYVAVQVMYIPDWLKRTKYYVDWFKYRRVVVINPANGKTVVAAVADAGPADWTGKHFGGSPEVMQYLGINYGMQNHPVMLFFLNDPNHQIPLGPLEYNVETSKS